MGVKCYFILFGKKLEIIFAEKIIIKCVGVRGKVFLFIFERNRGEGTAAID